MTEIRVVRKKESKSFLEDGEHCRLYVNTGKIVFGTSSLMLGKRGGVDPGHKEGDEIFFVARGRVLCYFPGKNVYHELEEGDIVIIPPKEPHQLINTSSDEAIVCWSLAPPDS